MSTIDKKAMVHFLNSKIDKHTKTLKEVENNSVLTHNRRIELILTAEGIINTLNSIIHSIELDVINELYDAYCITNGLDRTGNEFLV